MTHKIEIDVTEIRRVYGLLEEIHGFFHQPLKFRDTHLVEKFAKQHYDEIQNLYYQVVWNWLPKEVQEKITTGSG